MASSTIDQESRADSGLAGFINQQSRSQINVPQNIQEVVDPTQLSNADRRLAEMGYVQVFPPVHLQTAHIYPTIS